MTNRNMALCRVYKRNRMFAGLVLSVSFFAVALMIPSNLYFFTDGTRVSLVEGSRCLPVDAFDPFEMRVTVDIRTKKRPADFAVLMSTTRQFTEGVAVTMDKFGNVYLAIPGRSRSTHRSAIGLLNEPSPLNKSTTIEFRTKAGQIVSGGTLEHQTRVKSVDNPYFFDQLQLRTYVDQVCVGSWASPEFAGDVSVSISWRHSPVVFQTGSLRFGILAASLFVFLGTTKPYRPRSDDDQGELS